MSLWRKYRCYEQRTAAFAGLSTVSSLPCFPMPPPHRIIPRKSVRCTFTDIYDRPDPVVDDDTSRSTRVDGFGGLRASVVNVQPARNATPEPKASASNSLAQMDTEVDREMRENFSDTTATFQFESPIKFTDSWMDNMIGGSRNRTNWASLKRVRPWSFPSPLSTMMPGASSSESTMQCHIWQRSNTIYSQVSKVSPTCSSAALKLSPTYYAGSIFKAVINGWASLSIQERSNPILQILKEIDQVFSQLDRTSRVAFMYKSHMVLKVPLKLVAVVARMN